MQQNNIFVLRVNDMQKFVVRVNKTTLEAPVYVNVQTSFVLRLHSIKLEKACYNLFKIKKCTNEQQ